MSLLKKKILSILLTLSLLLCLPLGEYTAFASQQIAVRDAQGNLVETFDFEEDSAFDEAIHSAFNYCAQNADANHRLTVVTPSGKYDLSKRILLTSYTTLDLTAGTELTNMQSNQVLLSPKNIGGYGGLTDFTLLGGYLVYNGGVGPISSLVRIAHAKNIRFEGVKLTALDHHIELAACKNFVINKCTFFGSTQKITQGNAQALQIDPLDEEEHFPSFPPYDFTMNDKIQVTNCSFSYLKNAMGTASLFAGYYHTNITISNNRFDHIDNIPINCSNYVNCVVSSNTITNSGDGIRYNMMKSDDKIAKVSKSPNQGKINTNSKSKIINNKISCVVTKSCPRAGGIYIFGNNVTAAKKPVFPKGNYAVYNILVDKNTINTQRCGIRMYDVKNSTVSNNTVNCSKKTDCTGIYLTDACENIKITSNKISKFDTGIRLKGKSKKVSLTKNTIANGYNNAIAVVEKSNASKIEANKISKNKGFGIYFDKSTSADIYTNSYSKNSKGNIYSKGAKKSYKFSNLSKPSVSASSKKKSKSAVIKWKKVSSAGSYVIYQSKSAKGTYKKVATVSAKKTSYTHKKQKKGKTYYYKVRAVKKANSVTAYSPYSKSVKVKIK